MEKFTKGLATLLFYIWFILVGSVFVINIIK